MPWKNLLNNTVNPEYLDFKYSAALPKLRKWISGLWEARRECVGMGGNASRFSQMEKPVVYKIWTNYPLRPRIKISKMILVKLGTAQNKNHIFSINKQTILQENNFFYHFIRFFENIKIINES